MDARFHRIFFQKIREACISLRRSVYLQSNFRSSGKRLSPPVQNTSIFFRQKPLLVLKQIMKVLPPHIQFIEAKTRSEYQIGAELFHEYVAREVGFDLYFQNFDQELKQIAQIYKKPNGCILLVFSEELGFIGCGGFKHLEPGVCELKRMYLRETGRGIGAGRALLRQLMEKAESYGYDAIRLDTLPKMTRAIHLYEEEGFYLIAPYYHNPVEDVLYYEKKLRSKKANF